MEAGTSIRRVRLVVFLCGVLGLVLLTGLLVSGDFFGAGEQDWRMWGASAVLGVAVGCGLFFVQKRLRNDDGANLSAG